MNIAHIYNILFIQEPVGWFYIMVAVTSGNIGLQILLEYWFPSFEYLEMLDHEIFLLKMMPLPYYLVFLQVFLMSSLIKWDPSFYFFFYIINVF